MASTKEIKRRIKSIRNTKKITKAMELVAASKMRKAISRTLSSRAYAGYSWDILSSLSEAISESKHPFFVTRPVVRELIILVSSNRGLCGAYNAQVIRRTIEVIKQDASAGKDISFVTVGKRGENAMRRIGQNIVATFPDLPESVTLRDIVPISNFAVEQFAKGAVDRVVVAYTDFISTLTQRPRVRALLPISRHDIEKLMVEGEITGGEKRQEYLFEPGYEAIIPSLVEKLVRMQVYQLLLESKASEESSRMLAMKNASDAAGEMIEDLTLVFNKARQASITREISEISAGMASVS